MNLVCVCTLLAMLLVRINHFTSHELYSNMAANVRTPRGILTFSAVKYGRHTCGVVQVLTGQVSQVNI